MSKNKKVILATIGILVSIILAVLIIRSPSGKTVSVEPIPEQVEIQTPIVEKTKELDETQQKIAGFLDETSSVVVKEAPNLWGRVVNTWNWFMEFDTKHAIILLASLVFILGIIATGGKKRNHH